MEIQQEEPQKPAEKYPELWNTFQRLDKEKQSIEEQAKPLRAERDKISNQIRDLVKQEEELRKKIEKVEHPRLPELMRQLSALSKAMGSKVMSQGEPNG